MAVDRKQALALEAGQIRARFVLQRGDFCLDVDVCLPSRGVTVIFGHSGSGKTSLLRAIAGLEHLPVGELSLGADTWQSDRVFLPTHKRPLAYVFQEASLFEHLNVAQNLAYGRRRLARKQASVSVEEYQHILALLDIAPLLSRYPEQLSGGERQRVAIARALLSKPQLLLMDEPLASLDFARKQEILSYLERLRRELQIPMLYVTHSTDEMVRLADHVLVLEGGRVRAKGSLPAVLADQRVLANLSDEPFTLLQGRRLTPSSDARLTEVDVGGLTIRLARSAAAVAPEVHEQPLRLRLLARDISLTLSPAADSSILNILPCRIVELGACDTEGRRLLRLECMQASQSVVEQAPIQLLAQLTDFSCEQLQLKSGMQVFAQIKAVSLLQ